MSENKEIEKLTGYHREAAKMAVFTSTVKQPDCSQLTEEQLKALLDACDHSKSSYAEEAASEDLRELREKFEQSQKEHCEVLHKLQEQITLKLVLFWIKVQGRLLRWPAAACKE